MITEEKNSFLELRFWICPGRICLLAWGGSGTHPRSWLEMAIRRFFMSPPCRPFRHHFTKVVNEFSQFWTNYHFFTHLLNFGSFWPILTKKWAYKYDQLHNQWNGPYFFLKKSYLSPRCPKLQKKIFLVQFFHNIYLS